MQSGQISDDVITASSALRVNYEPWLARLHSQLGEGAWCAGVSKDVNNPFHVRFCVRLSLGSWKRWLDDFSFVYLQKNSDNQYLQVDLQHLHQVKRVATQGKYAVPGCIIPDAWVTSYMMQFRQDTTDWWNYTEDGDTKARITIKRLNCLGHVTRCNFFPFSLPLLCCNFLPVHLSWTSQDTKGGSFGVWTPMLFSFSRSDTKCLLAGYEIVIANFDHLISNVRLWNNCWMWAIKIWDPNLCQLVYIIRSSFDSSTCM